MQIVDAHCHLGTGLTYSQSAEELLRRMDANGVAMAVIVPADRQIAVDNEQGNREMLHAVQAHPDRFIPWCTANPWFGDRAVEAVRQAFDQGAKGLHLHPVLQGFTITDDIVNPLVEECAGQNRPIYFHTGTPVCSTPFQLSELAMRYPDAILIMGHIAYSDYWNDVEAAAKAAPGILLETSAHLASFIRLLVNNLGPERFLYGSDSPHNDMPVEIEKITRYIHDAGALEKIFAGNLQKLMREAS